MDSHKTSLKILMFPWLAHGHIFPYLELAKRISSKKSFHIYLCTTAVNFPSITTFLHTNSLEDAIDIIQLHLPPHPELPPHLHTTKNLSPNLIRTLLKAFQTSKSSFSDIIVNLTPDLLIYDIFQPWAAQLSLSLGIPAVHFAPFGAATTAYSHQYYVSSAPFPFPELYLNQQERESFYSLMDFLKAHVYGDDKDGTFINYKMSTDVVLLKTCRGLESKYLDYVSSVSQKRILAVGPLAAAAADVEEENSGIMKWLSKKPRNSTVYVSFGSEYFLSEQEISEIAKGLELCQANFIWVIRFQSMVEAGAAIEGAVPRGFLERVGVKGVVTGWAPQAKVLGHPSIGAFVSHCGWSSLNESLYYGVPVVAMPMKLNMVVDAKVLGVVGAGVEVRRRGDGMYRGEEIGEAIKEVMEGEGLKRRARELGEKMRMEEGDAIDEAAQILCQLCSRNKGGVCAEIL